LWFAFKKSRMKRKFSGQKFRGAPEEIRTPAPQIRSLF